MTQEVIDDDYKARHDLLMTANHLLQLAEYARRCGIGDGEALYQKTIFFLGELAKKYQWQYDLVEYQYRSKNGNCKKVES